MEVSVSPTALAALAEQIADAASELRAAHRDAQPDLAITPAVFGMCGPADLHAAHHDLAAAADAAYSALVSTLETDAAELRAAAYSYERLDVEAAGHIGSSPA